MPQSTEKVCSFTLFRIHFNKLRHIFLSRNRKENQQKQTKLINVRVLL